MNAIEQAMSARREGRYEEALRLTMELFERMDDTHFITMFSWRMLMDDYPPAREAMIRTRDAQVVRLQAGDVLLNDGQQRWPRSRFQIIARMNEDLQDSRATYELFLQLLAVRPGEARREAARALPSIVEAGDYALADTYLEDPLPRLEELNAMARELPLLPAVQVAPRLAAELHNFINEVRMLAAVHEGLGRSEEAAALRDAALVGLDAKDMRTWAARELADPGVLFREFSRVEVRYTTEDDWQELKRVRLAALLDAPTAFGVSYASAVAYTDEAWRERAAGRGPARYILAFEGEDAVGIVAYVPDAKQELNLIAMWVSPEQRGTPTASRLVDAVKTHAKAAGHPRILLGVAPTNARAAAFYQNQGFTFLPEWEALESHPHIQVQKMAWKI